jgi:hypothetical protein
MDDNEKKSSTCVTNPQNWKKYGHDGHDIVFQKYTNIPHVFVSMLLERFKMPFQAPPTHTIGLQQLGISPFTLGELLSFFILNNNLNSC